MQLPNGNKCSKPAIYPSEYADPEKIKINWYVHYRFYNPQYPKGYPVKVIQNINQYNIHKERVNIAERIRADVEYSLVHGYDPVKKDLVSPIGYSGDVTPETPMRDALEYVMGKVRLEAQTKKDVANVLQHFLKAAKFLKYDSMPMSMVKKRVVRMALDRVGETKGDKWTPNNFNHYRKYLSILFKELMEIDVIEFNPVAAITKQKTIKKHRAVLTPEERKTVNDFLKAKHRRFWLFLNIFFHSGSRTTEILKVKGEDVDLVNEQFKVTIIKGSSRREVMKVIKHIARPFWEEVLQDCKPDQYVFSNLLKPGYHLINAHQINRRWRAHVKLKLGIKADFYSLKHLATDETTATLSLVDAAAHNSHSNTATTRIYAVNERERQAERLKKSGTDFAS